MPPAPAKNPNPLGLDNQGTKDLWRYNLTNHKPTAEGIRKIEALRSAAKAMADAIIDICPPGRDQAMALSSNEQMLFHANAAVARTFNEDNMPVDEPPEEDKHLQNPTNDTEETSEKEA